jgi:hypothetical protein
MSAIAAKQPVKSVLADRALADEHHRAVAEEHLQM